jgi:hypothetical protein
MERTAWRRCRADLAGRLLVRMVVCLIQGFSLEGAGLALTRQAEQCRRAARGLGWCGATVRGGSTVFAAMRGRGPRIDSGASPEELTGREGVSRARSFCARHAREG